MNYNNTLLPSCLCFDIQFKVSGSFIIVYIYLSIRLDKKLIMAKNTISSAFRKIDVDIYNDDYYKEEEASEPHSPPTGPDEQEIVNLVNQAKHVDALKILLRSAPIATKNQSIKDAAFNLVLKVILSIKTSDIEKTVSELDRDQIDMLMKYVYKGFENPSEGRSAHLLAWHEKVYAAGGIGSIVRVLTDRKRV